MTRVDAVRALIAQAPDDGYRRGVVVRFAKPDPAKVRIPKVERRLAWLRRG